MAWKSALRSRRREHSYHPGPPPPRRKRTTLLYKLGLFSFLGVIGMFIVVGLLLPIFAFNLPSPDKVVRREGFSTKIYDRTGILLYDIFNNQRRTPIKLADTPKYLKDATVAIEDKNFYKHGGYDPTGMVRAFVNILIHRKLQGGSTLTQQVVKNVLLTIERNITRKLREFVLALQIERKYKKDEILAMYLNEVPYGGTAWGVQAAAETYFGKNVKDLTLVESAVLAGFPQRPSAYSPYSSTPTAYIDRTKGVLRRMREDKYITKDQEKEAVAQLKDIKFQPKGASFKAPHFVNYVQTVLEE